MSDNLLLERLKDIEIQLLEYRKQEIPGENTGWIADTAAWTYASATTLTITGDVTARFPVGTKIKLTQTTVKYFYVVSATYSAPNTTITLTGGSDYSLANAAITIPYYSYQATPQGFPDLFNWTPAVDQNGARTITVVYAKFRIANKAAQVWMRLVITDAGTAGNVISVSGLPVVGSVQDNNAVVGTYQYLRSGIVFYNGAAVMVPDGVHLAFYVSGQADKLGVLPSFATANNDVLGIAINYMIA